MTHVNEKPGLLLDTSTAVLGVEKSEKKKIGFTVSIDLAFFTSIYLFSGQCGSLTDIDAVFSILDSKSYYHWLF